MKMRKIILGLGLLIAPIVCFAQNSLALPFLTLAPDARGAGMGGNQYGETVNMYMYGNATSFLYGDKMLNVSGSFLVLPKIEDAGRNMYYGLSASYKVGNHGISAGFRYMGGLNFAVDGRKKAIKPMDMSFDLGYAYRLDDHWSGSLSVSCIQSTVKTTAIGVGFGAGVYYRNTTNSGRYIIGLNGGNLGTQMDYGRKYSKSYLPGYAGLGGEYTMLMGENALSFSGGGQYYFMPVEAAMFTGNVGVEYNYAKMLSGRIGFIYGQHDFSRVTFGAGYNYNDMLRIDGAYELGLGGGGYHTAYITLGYSM